MQGTVLIYHTFDEPVVETHRLTKPPSLAYLQGAVDGYIEAVPGFDTIAVDGEVHACRVYCNEEGKLKGLKYNDSATILWHLALTRNENYPRGLARVDGTLADTLCGSVVVLFGDDEFMDEV